MARPLRIAYSGAIYHYLLELCRYVVLNSVRAGIAAIPEAYPWSKVQGQIFIGSAKFMEEMKPLLEGKEALQEVPKVQRFAHRPDLKTALSLKSGGDKEERNKAIRGAYFKHGYPLKEIGRHLGLHYTTISKIINCNE